MNRKVFRHYKGGLYTVIGIGKHTETLEEMVLYYGQDNKIWIRPLTVWNQPVTVKGVLIPRFTETNEPTVNSPEQLKGK